MFHKEPKAVIVGLNLATKQTMVVCIYTYIKCYPTIGTCKKAINPVNTGKHAAKTVKNTEKLLGDLIFHNIQSRHTLEEWQQWICDSFCAKSNYLYINFSPSNDFILSTI